MLPHSCREIWSVWKCPTISALPKGWARHPQTHHNGWMLHEMVLKFEVDSFIGWPQKWENRDGAFMGGTRVTLAKGWMLAYLTPKFWSIFEDGL